MNNEGCYTFLFFAAFIAACLTFSYMLEGMRCSEVGKILNYKTEYHFLTGCVVEKPTGDKVLLRQMRDMEK